MLDIELLHKKARYQKNVCLLVASLIVFLMIFSLLKGKDFMRENTYSDKTLLSKVEIEKKIDSHIDVVNSVVAFFNSSDNVNLNEWETYSSSVYSKHSLNDFSGIGYIEKNVDIKSDDLFLEKLWDNNTPLYIKYFYPEDNVLSERALFSGNLSKKFISSISSGDMKVFPTSTINDAGDLESVLVFLHPLYDKSKGATQDRKESVTGFIYSTINTVDLFGSEIYANNIGYLDVVEKYSEKLLYSNNYVSKNPGFKVVHNLNVLGNFLELRYSSDRIYYLFDDNNPPYAIILISLIFILLGLISVRNIYARINKTLALKQVMEGYSRSQAKLKKQNRKLKNSYKKLKEYDILKDHFISMVSHELRTPLTVINGYLGLFVGEKLGKIEEKQKPYFERMRINVDYLLNIINDTLDLSKLENGKIHFNYDKFNLHDYIKEIVLEFKDAGKEKGNIISYIGHNIYIYSDEMRIRQVVTNLISNANKFTENGKIIIILTHNRRKNIVNIVVKDNGTGIKKENLGKLFQRFTQIDPDFKRENKGTGLGLCISKLLVEGMGGKMKVNSEYEVGSEFSFTLPIKKTK